MKRIVKSTKGLIKGAPTAVLLSIGIHLALFAVAGGMVVFSVVKKMEKKFTPPPPIERPKMELKKPKVKVKKKAKPKASTRIVSKSVQGMTDIQLPEISGMGEGLSGGVGGFEMMPDPADMSLYGGKTSLSIGNDFEGTIYLLGLDRRGKRNTMGGQTSYYKAVRKFYESNWNPRSLSMYYRAPQKLYATFFYIPMSASEYVPRSFGIPDDLHSKFWVAHYKGNIMSKEGGKFRFWGRAENMMGVRINGKEILQGGHIINAAISSDWRSTAEEHRKFWRGHGPIGVGDWFELEPGVPVQMEIIFGDENGVWTQAALTIQKYGEFYNKNEDGGPILPVFKTAEIPQHLKDEITYVLIPGEADLDSNMMFNVY